MEGEQRIKFTGRGGEGEGKEGVKGETLGNAGLSYSTDLLYLDSTQIMNKKMDLLVRMNKKNN